MTTNTGSAPSTPPPGDGSQRKRVRSNSDDEMADATADTEITPKPPSSLPPPSLLSRPGLTEPISTTGSSASSRSRGGTSAPSKRLRQLALCDDGLERRPLSGRSNLPAPVLAMLDQMEMIDQCIKIVPRRFEAPLATRRETDPKIPQIKEWQWADDDFLDPDVTLGGLLGVLASAIDCDAREASETHWNNDVHSRILEFAIGQVGESRHPLLSVVPCTTASVFPRWLASTAPGKKVDYCYIIDTHRPSAPDARPEIKPHLARIDKIRKGREGDSINHANTKVLERCPIAVSVETKRHNAGGGDKAELQMGVWLAAQWKSLGELCGDDPAKMNALPFLPALVVTGHHWSWAVATREGSKTVLYSPCLFGSTHNIMGIFRILAGVRLLVRYAETVLWPWFKDNILL